MTSLHNTQRRFYEAVHAGKQHASLCCGGQTGMAVYRNNLRVGARNALAVDYPAIERLVGAQCFSHLSGLYTKQHPSRSGDLQEFCHAFPDFLKCYYRNSRYTYLADVAELELAMTEALTAPVAETLVPAVIATWPPEALVGAGVVLAPCVRAVESRYPILTIWRHNQGQGDPPPTIDLSQGGESVLVYREHGEVMLESLGPGEAAFLRSLAWGMSLFEASDFTQTEAVEFDLQQMLVRLFRRPLVSAIVELQHE